jgi:hypothetical protein
MFTHDPGGANALGAVAAALGEEGDDVTVFAAGPAVRQLTNLGVRHHVVASAAQRLRALTRLDADVVVTGTSADDNLELDAIAAAANAGIPSAAVVDYWANYRRRFQPRGRSGDALCLPDLVTALDRRGAEDMVRDGLPADRVRVTGQPHFARLIGAGRPRRHARPLGPRRLLFASQPGPEAPLALRWLAQVLASRSEEVAVSIRLHPREEDRSAVLARLVEDGLHTTTDDEPNALASVAQHDAVLGVTSTLLIEAALSGCPTASILPGAAHDPLAAVRAELIDGLSLPGQLAAWLDAPQAPSPHAALVLEQRGADGRVVALIRTLAFTARAGRVVA